MTGLPQQQPDWAYQSSLIDWGSIGKRIRDLFKFYRGEPLSILRVAKPVRATPTSKLFIIHTDFPIEKDLAAKLDAQLEPLRAKFGLDFLVLEPGIKLTRFDDI